MNLSVYNRKDLSNFLQIAQQASNAGFPLPEEVLRLIRVTHDALLIPDDMGDNAKQKKPQVKTRAAVSTTCPRHGCRKTRLECGKLICLDCYDEENNS